MLTWPVTIELLYHAISILSCRSQSFRSLPESSTRQRLSAVSIKAMASDDFLGSLVLLPVVPYALLLSLRVSYWELRTSKVPMLVARARKDLLLYCQMLRDLGEIFWSVIPLADRAEKAVREVEKVVSLAASQKQQQPSNEGRRHITPQSGSRNGTQSTSRDTPKQHFEVDHFQYLEECDPSTFDSSMFDDLTDLDIFAHFDPTFDLEGTDTALGESTYFGL